MKNVEKISSYRKFIAIMALSFILMYAIMFLNVNELSHVFINITRVYMTLLMISAMAVLMIVMMYPNKQTNRIIITCSVLVFVLAFIGVHKQIGISDIQYMEGMIPHHSIAIMTSENAHIKDARVRKLADGIIKTQENEIVEMKALIDSLKKNR